MSLATFLNGRGPDRLRGLQFLAFSDVGVVLARSATSDSGGGATLTWGTAGTVSCRVDPMGDPSVGGVVGGQIDERSTHLLSVPTGSTVSLSGRVVVAGRGTFEVTAERLRTSEFAHEFEVLQVQ